MDHGHLREALRRRVHDGVLLRLVGKWLNAGVLDEGVLTYPESGSPQGGVISPMLANIFLHEVLDTWFDREVKPRMSGEAHLYRYADDAVLVFSQEADARRVLEVLPKRFGRYGLTLHPEKTKLVEFRRPARRWPSLDGSTTAKPGTFNLLGFTHYWSKSRNEKWVIKRKTASDRFRRSLKRVAEWCRKHLHDAVPKQWQALVRKLRGHFGYFGLTANTPMLARFRFKVVAVWRKWLNRRSRHARMTWQQMRRLLKQYPLPQPPPTLAALSRRAAKP
jgi:hypothetical protein